MAKTETLEDLYKQKFNWMPEGLQKDLGHFNVFRHEDCVGPGKEPVKYTRRDYYKIALINGHYIYHYADKSLEVNGGTLLFFNPTVPYTFEAITPSSTGFFCIFKDAFFSEHMRGSLKDLPMYMPGASPAYLVNVEQEEYISNVFTKMIDEMKGDYQFKFDLIRNYIMEMVHYAIKMRPTETLYTHIDANSRITSVFTELLERQFPIESPAQQFTLRSAKDFASQLNVHVNHLNRAIKLTTGKTTSDHIFERLLSEAKALLRHTDWNISEISYALGFDESAHFNHFFKKQTNATPSSFRS
ncbi:AraC family transcriptional regulator [Flavobacterium sp. NRK1]|uniref:helix-turn-helix domain-containing protein n=1 Tax=Flavobacterium sp. NRK1 TaxID=2954929 RepID=UPI0020924569|nr:helix-turn-helix transcriptional regulator [Flavobacterium sp. NRK1]MCO6149597.1 helix-turn-helix transcriptional regulator [Flavobacterium sp. NRK1]